MTIEVEIVATTSGPLRKLKVSSGVTPLALTLEEARLISVAAQGLDVVPPPPANPDKAAILAVFDRLGTIQLDSISVVARSHETVLWSRLGSFDPKLIDELYTPDNVLFEYLGHAASIVPRHLMPYFRSQMDRYRDADSKLYREWALDEAVVKSVLEAIRERGPLSSRAFERPEGPRPAAWSWWGDKPAKKALDYLWRAGELTIAKREGFQRIYDLMERRAPGFHAEPRPSAEEQRRVLIGRALDAIGIGATRWVSDYFRTGGQTYISARDTAAELAAMEAKGVALPVVIPEIAEKLWLAPAMLSTLERIRSGDLTAERTTLLSPFDSLVWFRARTLALFGFDYRLECYTPAPKRQFGYYTLPILHRGAIVGRLDPVIDRKRGVLTVNIVHLEPDVFPTPELATEIVASLRAYNAFLGGRDLVITAADPAPFLTMLHEALIAVPAS